MKLDQDFLFAVGGPIRQVWYAIAADMDPDCNNQGAIELCLDADRIVFFTKNQQAEDLISAAIDEHGLDAVYSYLSANINLV